MLKSTRLLIVLAVLAGIALCAVPALADSWDAVANFSTTSATGAVNGWSYGYVSNSASIPGAGSSWSANNSYSLYTGNPVGYNFTTFTVTTAGAHGFRPNGSPLSGGYSGFEWVKDLTTVNEGPDLAPMIGLYTGTTTGGLGVRIPPNPPAYDLYVQTSDNARLTCILRWTAPAAGNYNFVGNVQQCNSGNHPNNFWVVQQSGSSYTTLYRTGPPVSFMNTTAVPFNSTSAVTLAAGDHLDFIVGEITGTRPMFRINSLLVTSSVPPGAQGVVKNSSGTPIAGATVTSSSGDTVTTGSDGTYVLTILTAPGTFTLTASAPSYSAQVVSGVAISGSGKVTQNFTLPAGNTISGTVSTIAGSVPLPAVAIVTADGIYSTSTDSAGYYSLMVTPGIYSLRYSKLEYGRTVIPVDASAGNVTQNVGLSIKYDLANDFSAAADPGGNWEYGFITATSYTTLTAPNKTYDANTYYVFPRSQNTGGENPPFGGASWATGWWLDWATTSATIGKNNGVVAVAANDGTGPSMWLEGGETVMSAGSSTIGNIAGHAWDNQTAVAKFTVPTSGLFTVSARFGAPVVTHTSHTPVALRYKPNGASNYTYWLGDSTTPLGSNAVYVNGFQGKAVNNFTDSYGSNGAPVQTYNSTVQLTAGDTIEALVGFNTNQVMTTGTDGSQTVDATNTARLNRYVQTDLTISVPADAATIVGTVTTGNATGNPPVPNATVTATPTAGGNGFTGITDATGVYTIGLPAGSYTLTSTAVGYLNGSGSGTVAAGGNTVVNISMNGNFATTMTQLKANPVGASVILTTPMQLASGIVNTTGNLGDMYAFDKKYGSALSITTDSAGNKIPTPEYTFYMQSDDRVSGIKCMYDGKAGLGYTFNPTWKVACTGVMALDSNGQKVFNVISIDSAVQASTPVMPTPLGKTSKSLANTGTLVKVWGKITDMQANPLVPVETDPKTGAVEYTYEYFTINDGGQSVKIPMHCQYNWMTTNDGAIAVLKVGDYVSVTGIAGTTDGTDLAVYPRIVSDINDYLGS